VYLGTDVRRSRTLTVGLFSKLPEFEYSRRRRVGLRTSIRASPERTTADGCATALAMSTGVERFTGEVSLRGSPDDPDAVAISTTAMTPNPADIRTRTRRLTRRHSIGT
jgi:hypothetical protein